MQDALKRQIRGYNMLQDVNGVEAWLLHHRHVSVVEAVKFHVFHPKKAAIIHLK